MPGSDILTCITTFNIRNTFNSGIIRSRLDVSQLLSRYPTLHRYTRELVKKKSTFTPLISSGYLMPESWGELDAPERAHKRRRISSSTYIPSKLRPYPNSDTAMGPQKIQQPVPELELTPIEQAIRTLLLDVKEYIIQQSEEGHEYGPPSCGEDMELRFTGGWVRDKILGFDSQDIDVAISTMTGYQFGMAVKDYLGIPANLLKYKAALEDGKLKDAISSLHKIEANPEKSKHLETVTTRIFGFDIDLVNLRKETYTDDSRNPQMEFGTPVEDALRRDATVNALFYNLNDAIVEDLTGKGLQDLNAKILRTPLEPYQTFKDDPLRVLRLIRFASRLGYEIEETAQRAMQNDDIKEALKLKISKERIGTELDKMLRGSDPRRALALIDRLELYPTIFASVHDEVTVDTRSWSLAYETLQQILTPSTGSRNELAARRVREILIRDTSDVFSAWLMALFSPWASVPARPKGQKDKKEPPPRVVEVSKEGIKADNKTVSILRDAAENYNSVIELKSTFLDKKISGTAKDIRQHVGLALRSWKKDWRMCVLMGFLQEVMAGQNSSTAMSEYEQFLRYIEQNGLLEIHSLRPIINGEDIVKTLAMKSGPWVMKAQDLLIRWQLLNPENTDQQQALDFLVGQKAELEAGNQKKI